jgi:dynein heavy chain
MCNLTGDILLSSGIIAYLGIFPANYREDAISHWVELLEKDQISYSMPFEFSQVLGNDVDIQDWLMNGLPNDGFSVDNAIILQKSKRWPLMIDPQI